MRLADIARELGVELDGDGDVEIRGVAAIDEAGEGDLSFVASPRYRRFVDATKAAALILAPGEAAGGRPALRTRDPYTAFARALALFDRRPRPAPGIHPTAVIGEGATIGEGASIGAYVVIGEGAAIGEGAVLHPHVVLYPRVRIGRRFTAHAGAVVREEVVVGDDVVLQPGAVVGADGFGFVPRGREVPLPIPQIGRVRLDDHVELGANATVDRATVGETRLGRGVKLDNLVMVGHGSRIGAGSMLAGQVGMAGSTRLGERVMAGGQAGFAGHLEVGDDVQVAARAGVVADVGPRTAVSGMPAVEIALWRRVAAAVLRLPDLLRRVRRLERALGVGQGTGEERAPAGAEARDEGRTAD